MVISLLLGGFVVYDKLLKKEDVKECPKEECQCENKTTECNCPTCESNKTENNTTTNLYQIFSANLKKKITNWNLNIFLAKDCI